MWYKGFLKKKKEKIFESREDMAVGAVISLAESVTSWTSLACVAHVSFTSWASPFFFLSWLRANQHGCVLRSSNLKQEKK